MESNLSRKAFWGNDEQPPYANMFKFVKARLMKTTGIRLFTLVAMPCCILLMAFLINKYYCKCNRQILKELTPVTVFHLLWPMRYTKMLDFSNYQCENGNGDTGEYPPGTVHVAITVCTKPGHPDEDARHRRQTLVLLKSIVLQQKSPFVLHLFYNEDRVLDYFYEHRNSFPEKFSSKIIFVGHKVCVPDDSIVNLYLPCTMIRLMLAHFLPRVDAVIYLDTDIIFLKPLDDLWKQFSLMKNHAIAMPHVANYEMQLTYPVVGPAYNPGVMLMNLTNIRSMPENWEGIIKSLANFYMSRLKLSDQCLLNIFSHQYPKYVQQLPCEWNYIHLQCWNTIPCPAAKVNGASLIHAAGSKFEKLFEADKRIPEFILLFNLMKEFQLGSDVQKELVNPILRGIGSESLNGTCSKMSSIEIVLTKGLLNVNSND